ncbi:UNVERIFIED_CONTAM: protein MAIN-LIKE 2 [Sesamum radiatum]|uniref:Protein MAIN-LIKE 2 n=1 Tax=Sesamum radiatum TaxID=300843 RepID=A0AAW2QIM5_SESRA
MASRDSYFHFSVGEATITLQDIAVIWALPVEGNMITGVTPCLCFIFGIWKNIDEESTSNWGTAVLAYLYRELCTASQRGKTNIGGAMQLLQIWAWSRIITLAPIPSNNVADLMPTIDDPENILPVPPYARRWSYHISQTHTAHNAIRIIRNTLDRMQENEFIWTPYLHGLPELQSLPAYATRTPWNIRCPLINYSIVEMHHVERVLRQFVVRPDVGNGRGTVPDYMNWYHQISRVQISHRIVSTTLLAIVPPIRDWEAVYNLAENMTQQAENSDPNDFTALRDLRSRTIAYGHQFMNFSSERYPSVRNRPPGTNEPVPSNVYTPAGPSNVYTEAGPSNVYTPAGPSCLH